VTLVARVVPESIPISRGGSDSPAFSSSRCSAARKSRTNDAGGARPAATALRSPAAFAYVSWSAVRRTSSASAAAASSGAMEGYGWLRTVALPAENTIVSRPRSLSGRFLVKALIVCISFANLSFLSVWDELLDRHSDFFRSYSINWRQLAAVIFDILLLALAFWIFYYGLGPSGGPLQQGVFSKSRLPVKVARLAGN